jgi:hypothetical protein
MQQAMRRMRRADRAAVVGGGPAVNPRCPCRPSTSGRAPVSVQVAAPEVRVPVPEATTGYKLPSTHLESSKKALEQLRESAVNRELLFRRNGHRDRACSS